MAFDPSIIMGYRGMGELPNPMNQLAQVSQIQNAQNQNALAQYQLNAARRAEEGQTAIGQAYGKFYTNQPTGEAGQTAVGQPAFSQMRQQIVQQLSTSAPHLIPGELAKIAAMEKEALQSKELQGKIDLQAPELQNRVSKQFKDRLVNVNSYDTAVQWLAAQYKHPVLGPIVGQEPFEVAVKQIPKDPAAFANWKNQNALGIEEYIKQNKPSVTAQDTATGGRLMSTAGLGGPATVVPGSEFTNAAISKAILEGRLDPNRVNGRNAKILATTLLANPDANVLELGVSAAGATAAERSLATQTAKMSTAANEASKMAGVVRDLSDKVDRTEFPTINAVSNAVSKGTGGKEIVQLNTSINALVNSYARAISPTGQPTVSDKNHAREVINSAYSTGQLSAILDVMQQEMDIAREAAGTASTELKASREKARGRGAETPAASTGQWKVVR